MSDVGSRLREADPLRAERALTADDLRMVRQRVVVAAHASTNRASRWQMAAIATVVVLTIAATIMLERRRPSRSTEIDTVAGSGASGARRQLQFATPGGTRVIWVFDSRFEP